MDSLLKINLDVPNIPTIDAIVIGMIFVVENRIVPSGFPLLRGNRHRLLGRL